MSAVRQDIKSMFHLNGMDQENSKIGHENQELEENIQLWERHNEVSGGDSAVGSDITPLSKVKEKGEKANTGEIAESVEHKAAPKMEEAGAKSAGFFEHGFGLGLRKAGHFGADMLIQTFTMGLLDFDMVKSIGSKLLAPFKYLGKAIKKIDYLPDGRVAALKGRENGNTFAEGVAKGAKSHHKISGQAIKNMFGFGSKEARQSGEKIGTSYAEGINKAASHGSKKISTKEMF